MIGKQFTSLFFSSFFKVSYLHISISNAHSDINLFYIQHNIQLWKEKWGLESSGMLHYMRLDCLDSATGTQKKQKKKQKSVFFCIGQSFYNLH